MAGDDWRIRIEVAEEHAGGLLERLGLELDSEARELVRELEARRLAVTRDGDEVFVYAGSAAEAARAQEVIEAELRAQGIEASSSAATRPGRCACPAARTATRATSRSGSSVKATRSSSAGST